MTNQIAISTTAITELRERTGVGLVECKKALQETEGDVALHPSPHAGHPRVS